MSDIAEAWANSPEGIKAFRAMEDAPTQRTYSWYMPDVQRLLEFDGQKVLFRSKDSAMIGANAPEAFGVDRESVGWQHNYSPHALYRTLHHHYVYRQYSNFRGSVDDRLEALSLERALEAYERLAFHAPGGWDAAFDGTRFEDA